MVQRIRGHPADFLHVEHVGDREDGLPFWCQAGVCFVRPVIWRVVEEPQHIVEVAFLDIERDWIMLGASSFGERLVRWQVEHIEKHRRCSLEMVGMRTDDVLLDLEEKFTLSGGVLVMFRLGNFLLRLCKNKIK